MTDKRKFVIQKHYCSDGSIHWDLMVHLGEALSTWRLNVEPAKISFETTAIEKIADHPLRFLDYQGPVQNNTARVEIYDKGSFQILSCDNNFNKLVFQSSLFTGVYTLYNSSQTKWFLKKIDIATTTKIGFIGLGIMGKPMAANLLKAGINLKVYTRTKSKADYLIKAGAMWSKNPADCADGCDIIITCVSDTPDVQAVFLGANGVLDSAKKGAICIDMSTICPNSTQKIANELAHNDIQFIDAPISGGEIGAIEAKLSIMAGGDEQAFLKVKPIFEILGRNIVYCGPSGYGQMTKLVNQVMVIHTIVSISEGFALAEKMGLDLQKVFNAVSAGAAGSKSLSVLGQKIIKGDLKPAFMVDLQLKDLRLVMDYAEIIKQPLPATALARELMKQLQAQGRGRDGTQALVDVIRNMGKNN